MQATDFDSTREAYFARTALPLNQQLSQKFGSLNALPLEIISLIFNDGSYRDLSAARLVSKSCHQIVDVEFAKMRSKALENFEMIRPQIFNFFNTTNRDSLYYTTNFILDNEGSLVAFYGLDEMMFVKDEEGKFKKSENFVPSEEHSTLTIDWPTRFGRPVEIRGMPEKGFARNVAEAMASLAQPIYQGSYSLADRCRAYGQNRVDWKMTFLRVNSYTINAILKAGTKKI